MTLTSRTRTVRIHAREWAPFLLLLAALGIVVASATLSLHSATRHRATATRALSGFARLAAWSFGARAYLRFTGARPTYVGAIESAPRIARAEVLRRLVRLDDSLAQCRCHAHLAAIGFAAVTVGAPGSAQYTPTRGGIRGDTAGRMRQLRDLAQATLPAQAAVLFAAPKDSSARWLLVIFPLYDADGRANELIAVDADVRVLRELVFAELYASEGVVLPEELVGDQGKSGNTNVAHIAVRTTTGGELFSSAPRYRTGYTASVPVGRDGCLTIALELSPAAARAILQGAIPAGEVRSILILAALGVLLLAAVALALRRANALARQRADFATAVTHELRTPLTQILLGAETLQYDRARSQPQREGAIAAIVREARRLVYLLENVLHFSRTERRGIRLARQPARLDTLVTEHVDDLQHLFAASEAQIAVEVPEPVSALVDADALALVLTNLIMNAVHHAPGSGIRVSVLSSGTRVEVIVDDGGPGVPPSERERVQRPFERMARSVAAHPGGSGIGLAVVRELTLAMHGDVRLEDAPGGGLRVRLSFERAPTESGRVEVAV